MKKGFWEQIKAILRGGGSLLIPAAIGAFGMLWIGLFGGGLWATLLSLAGTWLGMKGVQRWGTRPKEIWKGARRLYWPIVLAVVGFGGLAAAGLLALGALGLLNYKILYLAAIGGFAALTTRRVLFPYEDKIALPELADLLPTRTQPQKGTIERPAREEIPTGADKRVLRAAQRLGRAFTVAEIAPMVRLPEAQAEQVLDALYVHGALTIDILDSGDIVYALPTSAPRLAESVEELETETVRVTD